MAAHHCMSHCCFHLAQTRLFDECPKLALHFESAKELADVSIGSQIIYSYIIDGGIVIAYLMTLRCNKFHEQVKMWNEISIL